MKKVAVTIRDVAREAGFSVATVSRYMNRNGYISDVASKKIQHVMDELDYKPNEIARGLARKRTNMIALIIPDITNPFFPELVVAIERMAKEKGYSLILINSDEEILQTALFWKSLQSRYIDGMILASFQFNEEILLGIDALEIPFVKIDRAADLDTENSIGLDNYKGAVLAVEHLVEVGCTKIAHIGGPYSYPSSNARLRGYGEVLKKRLPNQEPIIIEGDFSLESGMNLTKILLQEHPDVDGLFLANDLMAIGSLKTLKQLGKRVPKDIAIIGFDGIKLGTMVEPEISTIEQPIYDIGVAATSRLIHLIENTLDESNPVQLDVRLVQRESTQR